VESSIENALHDVVLEAIRSATQSVCFETYIYWEGGVGQRFADALSERARAGIPVHVTIDWVGSHRMDQAQLKQMEDAGVQVHRYRPLHWYNLGRLNNRTHRKLLIVDGRIGFTGGIDIGDPWDGNAQDADHWRDMHFRIEGPVVAQFQAAFNDNWIKTTGRVLNGVHYFPPLAPAGDTDAQMAISSPAGGSESTHLMYLMAIAAAERTIDLEAAYFLPDEVVTRALLDARDRGVRIRVIVPGEKTDSDAARHARRAASESSATGSTPWATTGAASADSSTSTRLPALTCMPADCGAAEAASLSTATVPSVTRSSTCFSFSATENAVPTARKSTPWAETTNGRAGSLLTWK
jgi:cardiolipin synthase